MDYRLHIRIIDDTGQPNDIIYLLFKSLLSSMRGRGGQTKPGPSCATHAVRQGQALEDCRRHIQLDNILYILFLRTEFHKIIDYRRHNRIIEDSVSDPYHFDADPLPG